MLRVGMRHKWEMKTSGNSGKINGLLLENIP